jgi:hypothetical protein
MEGGGGEGGGDGDGDGDGDGGGNGDGTSTTGWERVHPSSPEFNPTVERLSEVLTTFTKNRSTGDNLHCLVVGCSNVQGGVGGCPAFDVVDVLPNGMKRDWSKGGCTSIGRFGAGVRRVFAKRLYLERRPPSCSPFDSILDALCEAFGEVEEWEGGDEVDIRELIGSLRVVKLSKEGGVENVEDEVVEGMVEDFIKRRSV